LSRRKGETELRRRGDWETGRLGGKKSKKVKRKK
jgi:hypothetical protein